MTNFLDELLQDAGSEAEMLLGEIEDLIGLTKHPVHLSLYEKAQEFRHCLEQGEDLAESQIRQIQGIYSRLATDIMGQSELN